MQNKPDRVATFTELPSPDGRWSAVCQRVEHHYEQGLTILVYCADEQEAAQLDAQLWTFRQSAFIPHVILDRAREPLLEPVVITTGDPGELESDVLVIASAEELPAWFGRFAVISDFAAVYDEANRQASRNRFAALRKAGYRMQFIRAT